MAKRKSSKSDSGEPSHALVIVESPAKARTISKFWAGFTVEASIGHVRDLPQGAKQIPAEFKGEAWSNLGVNVNDNFTPIYIIPPGKSKQIKLLKDLLKDADDLYLATDEDREGEAISWHLLEVLKPKVPVHRLVFHEITKDAIQAALRIPRDIDDDLVRAQETRRILDRLYGYEVSPLLWRKVRPKLSAGRVQSVAVRLIVERERERMAFVSATYWDLIGTFAKTNGPAVRGRTGHGRRPANSRRQGFRFRHRQAERSEAAAARRAGRRRAGRARSQRRVPRHERSKTSRTPSKPYPPFTTSTLQQEANRKLGFTARRTMQVAQSLYENGHITYMRTDSTNLASVAIETRARTGRRRNTATSICRRSPRVYQAEGQERPRSPRSHSPGRPSVRVSRARCANELNADEFKLFDLIWKRTMASQMADARGRRITITIEGDGCVFQVSGKTIDFPGYLRAYVEGSDDPEAELADQRNRAAERRRWASALKLPSR